MAERGHAVAIERMRAGELLDERFGEAIDIVGEQLFELVGIAIGPTIRKRA